YPRERMKEDLDEETEERPAGCVAGGRHRRRRAIGPTVRGRRKLRRRGIACSQFRPLRRNPRIRVLRIRQGPGDDKERQADGRRDPRVPRPRRPLALHRRRRPPLPRSGGGKRAERTRRSHQRRNAHERGLREVPRRGPQESGGVGSMERTEVIMDMPITVSISPIFGSEAPVEVFKAVFAYFREIDEGFSPFKAGSEVSRMSRGELAPKDASPRMKEVLRICDETEAQTGGYFSAWYRGSFDPSGVVKGWAVREASRRLDELGFFDHCIEAGGDIEARGLNAEGRPWEIGIRNPFDPSTIIKVLRLSDRGIATSGTYIRGDHIYNPQTGRPVSDGVASL